MNADQAPPPAFQCDVCGRVLIVLEDGPNLLVRHPGPLFEADDHTPIPVMMKDPADSVGVCDFCGSDDPRWTAHCLPFEMHGVPGAFGNPDDTYSDSGEWAACNPCKELVEAEQWDALIARYVVLSAARHPNGIDTRDGQRMLREFAKHYLHEVVPG